MRGFHVISASGTEGQIWIRVANRTAFFGSTGITRTAAAVLIRSLRRHRCRITRSV
jgi:hypothetical protein